MKFNKEIHIEGRLISQSSPTFVIAEAGVNYGGNMFFVKKLIDDTPSHKISEDISMKIRGYY